MGNSDDAVPAKIKYALTVLGSCLGVWFTSWALIKAPNVQDWAMYAGLAGILACSAVFLLLAMFYKGTSSAARDVIGSSATWGGLAAIALLVLFIAANLISDATSAPKITQVKAESAEVAAGGLVNVTVDADYTGHGELQYAWQLDGAPVTDSRLKQVQVVAPPAAGIHKVTVVVSGGGRHDTGTAMFRVLLPPPKLECEKPAPVTPPSKGKVKK